ncbi:MerR family transcriptional regulator [Nocardia uniformis]|uniref:MerR family transcriptional regulator n=1 Tax=Nocardia uniformis TaxID=53432 RepID=A0A849BTZ6_9NOCA|nr:MerR family transcriptional regulator [Nocardia uniformis]NNH68326.1 MerR family transcriptional regulator [Nocardia uniformis]
MAWSTRELAELAGTSLRTVRHYHEVGLLTEPERAANGYKRYGVAHLLRLLHIKRLTHLGFSLSQIAAMGAADEHPEQALRELDAELVATIERLQRARADIALLLQHHATPTDLPPEMALATAATDLSDADRAFLTVATRVLSPTALDAYTELLRDPDAIPAGSELDRLPADADERTRAELADRLFPQIRDQFAEHPGLSDRGDTSGSARRANQTMALAAAELYNPAQLDVMRRIGRRFQESQDDPDARP